MTEADLKLAQAIYIKLVSHHADKVKFLNAETLGCRDFARFSLDAAKVFQQICVEHKDD
jgi:hypothetical protein